jgi:hypothetical protein
MADVTTTIGTSSRTYSTMVAWEADLDNGGTYSATDNAIGECYNDSTFTATVTFDGGGSIGLTSATLRPASGQGHTGLRSTGVRVIPSSSVTVFTFSTTTVAYTLDQIEVSSTDTNGPHTGVWTTGTNHTCSRLLIYDFVSTNGAVVGTLVNNGSHFNNFIMNISCTHSGSSEVVGYRANTGGTPTVNILNNTIHNIISDNGSGASTGVEITGGTTNKSVQNNIATTVGGTTSGAKECYNLAGGTTRTNNISSDTTATGTDSIISVSASTLFISTVGGSENLHLLGASADAYANGIDLNTTPTGVNIDIDGHDRESTGRAWDIGADQLYHIGVVDTYYHKLLAGI